MKTSDIKEIEAFIKEHQGFAECIIEELLLQDYGTTFEVVFDYVWTRSGQLRANLDEPQKVILRFRLVQELHFNNSLTSAMLKAPEAMNWGMNEVALLKVIGSDDCKYQVSSVPFTHVAFLWEGERRIDVIFSQLEVVSDVYSQG